jgi:hypothetical protein
MQPKSLFSLTCLFELALPLEAESSVDKELAEKREEGHDNGDAVSVSAHLFSHPSHDEHEDLPEDNNCEAVLAMAHMTLEGGSNILNGQISVGMFLSWRMRWETVWAALCQCGLWLVVSVNWLTAVLLLLFLG